MQLSEGVESILHEVWSAYPVAPYHSILEFETGEYRTINVRPFLEGAVFEPLKDPAFFQQPGRIARLRKSGPACLLQAGSIPAERNK